MVGDVLTLKHYKEPLRAVPRDLGYGFFGALSISVETKRLQCHVCGKLFDNVAVHARSTHKLSVRDYRETYQLSATTALVSEPERERMKERGIRSYAAMTAAQKRRLREQAKEARAARERPQPKEALEAKNKKGTCPDQLLDRIIQVKEKIGHVPSLAEFIHETGGQRYKHLIYKTFGSWANALKMLGYETNRTIQKGPRVRRSDEELLEYLALFAQENGTIPSHTDAKRGLIPDDNLYKRRFGSFENARKLAGVYDFVERVDTL